MPTIILPDKIKHKGDFPMEMTNNVPLNGTNQTKDNDILVNESMMSVELSKHLNTYKYNDRPTKFVELAELGLITSKIGNTTNGIDNSVNKFKGAVDKLISDTNNSSKQNLDISIETQQDMLDRAKKIMEDMITVSFGEGSDFANSVNPDHVKSVQNQMRNMGVELVTNLGELFKEQNSFDNPNSPISKVRSDMAGWKDQILKMMAQLMDEQNQHNQRAAEHAGFAKGKKEEYERGTYKGIVYEDKLYEEHIAIFANQSGDISEDTSGKFGALSRKVGDSVITFGETSGAPNQKIVVEVKDDKSYSLEKAIAELKIAKENRAAKAGIFVWSENSAPSEVGNFKQIGSDIYCTAKDDLDKEGSSLYVKAAITIQKGIIVSGDLKRKGKDIDADSIRMKINSIINSLNKMDTIIKKAKSISTASGFILKNAEESKEEITSSLDDISVMINGGSVSIGSENNLDN